MAPAHDPSLGRKLAVIGAALAAWVGAHGLARPLGRDPSPAAALASVALGVASTLVVASIGEWLVHRYAMHRRLGPGLLGLPHELHHRAHHWVQFPPDAYVEGARVDRVPWGRARDARVCATSLGRALVVASHLAFYSLFALPLVVAPAFAWGANPAFAWSVTATTGVLLFLFVHVHDAVHHPGHSPLESARWLRLLDRHHDVHHVDTQANTNFLLPLGDRLFGTLRRELTAEELARWPSHEEARRRVATPPRREAQGVV